MAELHVHTSDGGKSVVPLGDAEISFGRSDECDFVLEEQRASRQHCTFKPVRDGWRVADEGSSNGTFLGGRPVLSVRLQPGDELEIGQTIIEYVAAVDETAVPQRRPRVRSGDRPSWGMLAIPLVFGVAAFLGSGAYEETAAGNRATDWEHYARTVVQRVDFSTQAKGRDASLTAALGEIPEGPEGETARRIVASAQATGAAVKRVDNAWRDAVAQLRVKWPTTSAAELRGRLADLLDRHADDDAAAAELRRLLTRLHDEGATHAGEDRERTFADAQRAVEDGRFGEALDTWNSWLLRARVVSPQDQRLLSKRYGHILQRARQVAELALERSETLLGQGRRDAARDHLDAAAERLHGTGYDAWLAVYRHRFAEPSGVTVFEAPTERSSASTRERTYALRALASAEELARLRRFDEAATRLEDTLAKIRDEELRSDLEDRLGDLRAEASVLKRIVAQVAERPRVFSPLRIAGVAYTVNGATTDVLLLERKGTAEVRAVAELPTESLAHLCVKAQLGEDDLLPAALLLWDVGERDAYTALMRRALAVTDDAQRLDSSFAHARLHGRPLPDGGYVPHPDDDTAIITWDEFRAIENAARIEEYTARLTKVVKQLEGSKQAKSIRRVAQAYQRLEEARNFALDLIFDEEKYFYPYRGTGREAEYAKVSHEVDERVQLVRDAWDVSTKAKPKKDKKIAAALDEAEDLQIEIEYLGGEIDALVERIERVTMYLDHELTVQTFFLNQPGLDLLEYNRRVMEHNRTVESVAEKSERRQVEVTNEYRIMFGHRRAVVIQDQLTMAARGHSEDMARLGFFDHFSPVPGKRSPSDRMRLAGYSMMGGSENIHQGSGSPEGAHGSWIHSSGHHRNILMPSWTEMGTGRSGSRWTQNFGFRDTDPI